jgi:hypothetical protein
LENSTQSIRELELNKYIKQNRMADLSNEISILFDDIQHLLENSCSNDCQHCEWRHLCNTIEEEKFFTSDKPEVKNDSIVPLGVAEKFSGTFCEDCTPFDLNDGDLLPDGWDYVYREFKCSSCRKEIVY